MNLERFIDAQARIWPAPLDEIQAGSKRTHWMWYIFPQMKGLGVSPTAEHYGIADLPEASAYLQHALLGPRLGEISRAMLTHRGTPARAIFGPVDTLKLRSSMTLFHRAGTNPVFSRVLADFFAGKQCEKTLTLLGDT